MAQAWVGIDCGKTGALSIIDDQGKVLSWHTPAVVTRTKKKTKSKAGKTRYSSKTEYDLKGMLLLLQKARELQDKGIEVVVAIEQQRQRPRDSKQVVYQVGRGQGLWEMACTANNLRYTMVLPATWKSRYVPVGADKQQSVDVCRKLYPKLALPLSKDEARAEATLIADFVRREANGQPYPLTPVKQSRRKKLI